MLFNLATCRRVYIGPTQCLVGPASAEPMLLHGTKDRDEVDNQVADSLCHAGLDPSAADRFPHEFSGGHRQPKCIARTMIMRSGSWPRCRSLIPRRAIVRLNYRRTRFHVWSGTNTTSRRKSGWSKSGQIILIGVSA
jgi:hypothetical protein